MEKNQNFKNSSGFSLIELILTLCLLSFAAMTVNFSLNQSAVSSDLAILKIIGDIRFAQQMALSTGNTYGFHTLTNHSYEIYVGSPGTYAVDPLTQGNFTIDLQTNFNGSTFGASNYQIQFDSTGTPTLGGGQSYTLTNGGSTQTFHVENATGVLKRI
jgi:prepilin-type N-terminal cleavage/methylation domain-containing protein